MSRITKEPEERRAEIIETAFELFQKKGYKNTSVASIIKEIGVAKGTFYYYFDSKDAVLEAIVNEILDELLEKGKSLVKDEKISALEKFESLFSSENQHTTKANNINRTLHHPDNSALHERLNIKIIKKLSPIMAEIVEQGKIEGVFTIKDHILETCQFLLAGGQVLFDESSFDWSRSEWLERRKAMQNIMEKTFEAHKGSFRFLLKK